MFLPLNPLAFPAGYQSGFDPKHVASRNVLFSGISSNGSFVNLLNGAVGSVGGTPTTVMDGRIGPSLKYTGNSDVTTFTFPTTAYSSITMASIFTLDTLGPTNSQVLISNNGTTNSAFLILFNASGTLTFGVGLGGSFSAAMFGVNAAVGVPYFFATAGSAGPTLGILKRLDTGQVWTSSLTPLAASAAGDGALYLGNKSNSTGTRQLLGHQSAAMVSSYSMSMQELVKWAMDPWSFWYPVGKKALFEIGVYPAITTRAGTGMMGMLGV